MYNFCAIWLPTTLWRKLFCFFFLFIPTNRITNLLRHKYIQSLQLITIPCLFYKIGGNKKIKIYELFHMCFILVLFFSHFCCCLLSVGYVFYMARIHCKYDHKRSLQFAHEKIIYIQHVIHFGPT